MLEICLLQLVFVMHARRISSLASCMGKGCDPLCVESCIVDRLQFQFRPLKEIASRGSCTLPAQNQMRSNAVLPLYLFLALRFA